jgi:hypothetical protein
MGRLENSDMFTCFRILTIFRILETTCPNGHFWLFFSVCINQEINNQQTMRVDLNVPYSDKDAAKELGAQFDKVKKVWFVTNTMHFAQCAQWTDGATCPEDDIPRHWEHVRYEDRAAARRAGFKWCPNGHCWYRT